MRVTSMIYLLHTAVTSSKQEKQVRYTTANNETLATLYLRSDSVLCSSTSIVALVPDRECPNTLAHTLTHTKIDSAVLAPPRLLLLVKERQARPALLQCRPLYDHGSTAIPILVVRVDHHGTPILFLSIFMDHHSTARVHAVCVVCMCEHV